MEEVGVHEGVHWLDGGDAEKWQVRDRWHWRLCRCLGRDWWGCSGKCPGRVAVCKGNRRVREAGMSGVRGRGQDSL